MPADSKETEIAIRAIDVMAQIDAFDTSTMARLPFSMLYAFANGQYSSLPSDFDERLAKDEQGQRDLAHLMSQLSVAEVLPAAAASTDIERRVSDDAVLTLTTSASDRDLVYVAVELTGQPDQAPTSMNVNDADGRWHRVDLSVYEGNVGQAVVHATSPAARALRDPSSHIYVR